MTTTTPETPEQSLLAGLNPEQQLAVTTTDGPVLIVAGPGSGKTRVLTVRIAHLIREHGVAPWNILAVTFTNKAAREMRERVEHLVGENARWITLSTFHAFCASVLRRYGNEIDIDQRFVIYDDGDQMSVVKSAMDSLDINQKMFSPRAVLSVISRAKSQALGPNEFAQQTESYFEEIVARVYPVYQAALRRRSALDFDDLLSETLRLMRERPETLAALQDRYKYVLVDEYQDTNHIQYLLVKELGRAHRNLCVVGDPDQSIYGWRAADIRNILTFKSDFPDATEIHLEENYRSTPQILSAADSVIRENAQRIDRRLRTSQPDGDKITLRESYDETVEAQFIVSEVQRLQREGVAGKDIAILYRTNWQSRPIEEAFIRAGMPYQLIGGTRFYERKEVRDALAMLRIIANPDDASAFQRLIAEFPIGAGIGAKTLSDLEAWSRLTGHGLGRALELLDVGDGPNLPSRARNLLAGVNRVLSTLRDLEPSMLLSELFDRGLEETGYRNLFDAPDPELADRWENLLQFRANLERFDDDDPETRLMTFLSEVALVSDADTIDDTSQAVTLITLHAVKGLEFDVVFLTGVEEGLLPHQRSIQENPEMLEEERRLFYVGITRAKKLLYITYAFRRSRFGSFEPSVPSSFLSAIPANLLHNAAKRTVGRDRIAQRLSDLPPIQTAPVWQKVQVGQTVFHTRFGDGIVTAIVDKPDDQELTIAFKRHGEKRLLASIAKLTVDAIEGNEGA